MLNHSLHYILTPVLIVAGAVLSESKCGLTFLGTWRVSRPRPAKQRERQRETSSQRGYSYAWQLARKSYLAKHPLCAECERAGLVVAATDLDHIVPHRGDKTAFWVRSNWQGLCHPCHSRKTAAEDGGWGNAVVPRA